MDVSKWEMGYDDMTLKKQVGSGQFGVVILACLKREATSLPATEYILKHTTPDRKPPPLLVAVKQFSGENCCCILTIETVSINIMSDYHIKFGANWLQG